MALALLLPLLLGGTEPQVIATGDYARVEQALSDGIRTKVEQGWAVMDVRTANNDELVVTLSKGETYERHVVHFDSVDIYRVETDVKPPTDGDEPSHFLGLALAAPSGGVEIESGCGEYGLRPYLVDEHATGEFAAALIARTLGSADNLGSASATTGKVTFGVTKKEVTRDLVVWLDPKGAVIEAQLRRFEYSGGGAAYKRMGALKKSLAKMRVTAVKGTTLILSKGTFALDPDGAAFGDNEEHGCGC
jgi:hypothetical protein